MKKIIIDTYLEQKLFSDFENDFLVQFSLLKDNDDKYINYDFSDLINLKKFLKNNLSIKKIFDTLININNSIKSAYENLTFEVSTNLDLIFINSSTNEIKFVLNEELNFQFSNNFFTFNKTKKVTNNIKVDSEVKNKLSTSYADFSNNILNDTSHNFSRTGSCNFSRISSIDITKDFSIEEKFIKILSNVITFLESVNFEDIFIIEDFYSEIKEKNLSLTAIKRKIYEKYLEYNSIYGL